MIFLDGDIFLEKAPFRLVEIYEEKRGLISVQPCHFMEKKEEKLSAFFIHSLNLSLSFLVKKYLSRPALMVQALIVAAKIILRLEVIK